MRKLSFAVLLGVLICLLCTVGAAAETVEVSLPTWDIVINDQLFAPEDQYCMEWPFLAYKNLTYMPLTYSNAQLMGLELLWDDSTGLTIWKRDFSVLGDYTRDNNGVVNRGVKRAELADLDRITVIVPEKGLSLTGSELFERTYFPFLSYNGIIYLPLARSFIEDTLGLYHIWTVDGGPYITAVSKFMAHGNAVEEGLYCYKDAARIFIGTKSSDGDKPNTGNIRYTINGKTKYIGGPKDSFGYSTEDWTAASDVMDYIDGWIYTTHGVYGETDESGSMKLPSLCRVNAETGEIEPVEIVDLSVDVSILDSDITVNWQNFTLEHQYYTEWPFLTYKDTVYFPLTYDNAQLIGVEVSWNDASGVAVNRRDPSLTGRYNRNYNDGIVTDAVEHAEIIDNRAIFFGKKINNMEEELPLLSYNGIVYMPLTKRIVEEELNGEWTDTEDGPNILTECKYYAGGNALTLFPDQTRTKYGNGPWENYNTHGLWYYKDGTQIIINTYCYPMPGVDIPPENNIYVIRNGEMKRIGENDIFGFTPWTNLTNPEKDIFDCRDGWIYTTWAEYQWLFNGVHYPCRVNIETGEIVVLGVEVSVPTSNITVNGEVFTPRDQNLTRHPFLVYNGLTYLPLTDELAGFVGLEAELNDDNWVISRTEASESYYWENPETADKPGHADIVGGVIDLCGREIDNIIEEWPLLTNDGIIYIPLTGRYTDELGWTLNYVQGEGLSVITGNL